MARLGAGILARGARQAQDFGSLAFRFLVVIDVEGFSQRHAAEQVKVQDDLEHAIAQTAADTGLDRQRWYRQVRGDGELAVLPEGTNGLSLVADYPCTLASAIATINDAGKSGPRLRVRMAIHHGAVTPGRFGPVGTAPVAVSRLADAEIVREQLRQRADLDIALIVSATVYNEVVQSRLHDLDPGAFCHSIIRAKGLAYVGYIYQGTFDPRARMASAMRQQSAMV